MTEYQQCCSGDLSQYLLQAYSAIKMAELGARQCFTVTCKKLKIIKTCCHNVQYEYTVCISIT